MLQHHTATAAMPVPRNVDAPERREPSLLIDLKEVCALVAVSESTLRRMMDAGDFPKGKALSRQVRRWRRADVEAWIAEKFDA
ncbi:helix-turn-helix transcriptional regulator [Tropicibacter naphthalenivorans]|uniref:Putative transcriptional regulator n=1 Tax=Tropicibacter naphthalenivorans TaxID=441103 RepID=A0A0P1G3K8_9RHOB|nr:helix-turn-helix domain-containing protein [Tropicibacter naphthalenivorans]CUH76291.1 putative transcriptional regulator [Tropicibacter naphthalenivorans]SMC38901.1 transcriptional regulator, AlpA family [Tropicibacter naphthalenivorans]